MKRFWSSFQQHRLLGGALVLAITQFGASVVGLIRDRLLDQTFPKLGVVDVYVAAFRPSDLLFQVCIMSAIGTILLPLLAGHKAHGRSKDLQAVLTGTMQWGAIVFGIIGLFFWIALPSIAPYLVHFQGPELVLYIRFARLAILINFLFVFGNAFGQYLMTEQRYWIYGLTPILYTIGTIFGTLFLVKPFGEQGPMSGTVLGAIIYVLYRAIGSYARGFRFRFGLWHPDFQLMGFKMLPRMLALAALQLQLLLFDTVASGLDTGSITINAFARNFQAVLVGVAGIAIAQSAFSLMSQAASKKEMIRFRMYVMKGLGLLLAVTVPGAVILMMCAPIAAWLVSLRHVYVPFSMCIFLYAISVPFESIAHLFLRAFYSLHDTFIPAVLGVVSGVAAVLIAWLMAPQYGVLALPFGYTFGQIIETMILGVLLKMRMEKNIRLMEVVPEEEKSYNA